PWTSVELKTADEEHGGMKIKTIVAARVKVARLIRIGLALGAAGAAIAAAGSVPELSIILGALTIAAAICVGGELVAAGKFAYRAIEECASELNLSPLGEPVGDPSRRRARAADDKPVGAPLPQERAAE